MKPKMLKLRNAQEVQYVREIVMGESPEIWRDIVAQKLMDFSAKAIGKGAILQGDDCTNKLLLYLGKAVEVVPRGWTSCA